MVEDDRIELRSEKVRNIIGQVPSIIVRFGTSIISIIILLLIIGGILFKYPITLSIPIVINSNPESVSIKAKMEGRIFYTNKINNQKIQEGDSIGWISLLPQRYDAKNQYINSPIEGKLLLNYKSGNWLEKNSIVCDIIPMSIKSYYIQTLVPYNYITKLHTGQCVDIELNGYSHYEYGFLKGYIDHISPITIIKNDLAYFNINITLSKGMLTTTNKSIEYTPAMTGNASIILSEAPLFRCLINAIR